MSKAMHEAITLEGTILERKYRVVRIVAEGGFAHVYAGEHGSLHIPIAVKVLKPIAGNSDELLARFALEAQTIARLKHPDIVQVLDTGVLVLPAYPRGLPWIVLEWLAGETMKEALAARRGSGGRRPSECLSMMRSVFSAIGHAHDEGIAHRDIKPSNVMMARTTRGVSAKVLDFGIAKIMEGDERPVSGHTATEGTVRAFSRHYAAPEQLAGSRTGPWTDIHALALMMSELLTDEPPYPADDAFELGQLIFDPVRPTPKKLGVSVGPWEATLARALSLRAAGRHDSAHLFFEELERDVEAADDVWKPRIGPKDAQPITRYHADSPSMSKGATGGTYSRTTDVEVPARRRLRHAYPVAAVALAGLALAVGARHSASTPAPGLAVTTQAGEERTVSGPTSSALATIGTVDSAPAPAMSAVPPAPSSPSRAPSPRRAAPLPRASTGAAVPSGAPPAPKSTGAPLPYVLE